MAKLLLLFIICPILDLTAARFLHNSSSILTTQRMNIKPKCHSRQYESNGICCDFCEPGFVAKSLGCTENHKTNCRRCIEGKEYMNEYNYKTACLRCNLCDTEHGMEIEKNCTINQNVTCRCKPDFFCNSTKPCRHCDKCDKCENGIIVENCAQNRNTVCGNKENLQRGWIVLFAVITVIVGLILWILWCKRWKMPKNPIHGDPNHKLNVSLLF
ncbi:tumor necrosis factor receptor superfamily member 6 [Liasis olivaceus]